MSQVNIYNFDPNDPNNTGRTTQQDGLNIFVSLQATPRKRTTKANSENKTVEFVKGTLVDGRNSLTTNYVNVGYDFSDDSELETLNIKTINIDFNSSYVPLVSIVFIDTRGDSLMAKGKSSRFANVFFDLPYPIFNLKIKGEYGKAVNYCLHLTKFNSKFNSATGDFEIFCDFIGYTYAFFSDILLGYLKAIGEFPDVKEQLKNEGLISINDFRIQNELLNSKIEKLNKTNDNYKQIGLINGSLNKINELNDKLVGYGSGDTEIINRIGTALVGGEENLINAFIVLKDTPDNQNKLSDFLKSLELNKLNINKKNARNSISFEFDNGTDNSRISIFSSNSNLTKNNISIYRNVNINEVIPTENISQEIYNQIKLNITDINKTYIIVSLYSYIKEIKLIISNLEKLKKVYTDNLSLDIESLTKTTFNDFEPTVYNVFNMFTRHIELFMDKLVSVGNDAETEHNKANSLISKRKDFLDKNRNRDFIPAFPMYYEENKMEKWLGSVDPKLPEVMFIEKMIDSLVNGNVAFNQTVDNIYGNDVDSATNYFPIHAKDIYVNPYITIGNESIDNIKKALTNRMLFAIYTNGLLTNKDVELLAKAEAYNSYLNIINTDVLSTLVNSNSDTIFNTTFNDTNFDKIKNLPYDYLGVNNNDVFNFNEIKDINSLFLTETEFNNNINRFAPGYAEDFNGINNENIFILKINNISFLDSIGFENKFIQLIKNTFTDNNIEVNPVLNINSPLFNPIIKIIRIDKIDYSIEKLFYSNISKLYDNERVKRKHLGSGIRFTNDINLINNDERLLSLNYKIGGLPTINTNLSLDEYTDSVSDIGSRELNNSNFLLSDFKIGFKTFENYNNNIKNNRFISLFGSEFYYKQKEDIRALLFLSSSPILENIDLFELLIGYKSSITKLPTLIPIILGCYLHRYDEKILFATGSIDSLNIRKSNSRINVFLPNIDEFYTSLLTNFGRNKEENFYKKIPKFILNLNADIRKYFKDKYKEWRDSSEFGNWKSIKNKLEINNNLNNGDSFVKYYKDNNLLITEINNNNYLYIRPIIDSTYIGGNSKPNLEIKLNDDVLNKIKDYGTYNYELRLKSDNVNVKELSDEVAQLFFRDFIYFINYNPYIWNKNLIKTLSGENYKDTYTKTFVDTLQELDKQNKIKQFKQDKKAQVFKELFNSENKDEIKLNIYRNIKSIYDKWVGDGVQPYKTCLGLKGNEKLIDTFKFIDKFHRPVGKQIYINPKALSNRISASINTSFVSLASSLLSDMKFDFIPLPSYLEYNDINEAKSLFKPFEYYDLVDDSANTTARPSFICMYINTASNRLDLENSNYNNDGQLFNSGDNTYSDTTGILTNNVVIPSFTVNYGSENQAIFKDIELNQNEFTTTDETLIIIDNLSNRDAVNESVFLGQNLFDIYSKRSYTAKISLLGNATLMPMHYFQLNNIPLFSGAYIITRVSHSISNNTMLTDVTGVRVSVNDVPIIRDNKLFLALATEDIDSIIIDNGNQINFNNTTTQLGSVGIIEEDFIDE